jgi:hypothetical protein
LAFGDEHDATLNQKSEIRMTNQIRKPNAKDPGAPRLR